jgi:hypothetical protein
MSDSKRKFKPGITNSQGIVVGEHNHIYQYFQSPQQARLASKHIGYLPLIARKTENFVGRKFVFDALDEFLNKNESGYFLLFGEPGIGKTAAMAQIVKMRGYPHHFNVATQNIRSPRQFLSNACAQVIARYDLPHEEIPKGATKDSNFLLQCLQEAAAKPENRPVVLIVDGLDEAERDNLPPRVNTLYLPPTLPEGAYIVASSRPLENLKLQVSKQTELYLEPDSEGNLLDIQEFIENFYRSNEAIRQQLANWGVSGTAFKTALVKKSEGNFIYLFYILPAIAEGKFKKGTLDELPQGLKAYYRSHWDLMQIAGQDEFNEIYAPIVCLLATVREPVTLEQLHNWTNIDSRKVRHAIQQWWEFLEQNGAGKFRIYHTSFQDFLAEMVDLKHYDQVIARYYLDLLK